MIFLQGNIKPSIASTQIYSAGLLLILLFLPGLVFADACRDASKDLRSSFEVTQGRGGLWGYMEQTSSLKEDSMIGFQVDGKLQRVIVLFENRCAKSKKPSKADYDKIMNVLGDARMIFNMRPGKNPAKEIKAKIEEVNVSLDKLITELDS